MAHPTARQRRLRYRQDARRAILDAAESLLVEGGADAFSMRRLAERCGTTPSTLYHYFGDKPGLVHALLEERLQGLAADLRTVSLPGDPVGNACALASAFARFGLRNPSHYLLLVVSNGDEAVDPPSREEVQRQLTEPLDELVARGELDPGDLEGLRQGLWCLLHGLILLQTTRPDEGWEADLLDTSLHALIRGYLDRTRDRAAPGGER